MISKLSQKKTSKFSKRILGMESLENRELLSINPLGYDGSDVVQTAATSNSQDFGAESTDFQAEAAGAVTLDTATTTATALGVKVAASTAEATYSVTIALKTAPTKILGTKTFTEKAASSEAGASFVFTGLKAGQEYTVTVTNTAEGSTETSTADLKTLPTSVTVAGPTSSGVTVNWTKPAGITDLSKIGVKYEAVASGTTFTAGAKTETVAKGNTLNLSGLTAGTRYIVQIVDDTTGISNIEVFETAAKGTAADVTVGPATDVKAAYTKPSGTKPASAKITWKAPANYTGGYTVTFTERGGTDTFNVKIAPGAKLEYTAAIDAAFSATAGSETLKKDTEYSVVIKADGTAIASSTTYVTTGTVAATLSTPNKAKTVAGAAITGVSGGTKVTFAADDKGTGEVDAVGYWVGLYADASAAAAAKVGDSNLIYVKAADIATGVSFSDAKATQYAAVIGVAVDGGTSAAVASAAAVAVGADIAVDTTYPAAAKGPKAALQTDGSYKVEWTNGLPTAPTTLKADSVKYEVDKWFVKYSSDGGKTWFSTGAAIDATTLTATVNGLVPGVSYQFAVEASVKKTLTENTGTAEAPVYNWKAAAEATKRCKTTNITVKVAAEKVATPVKASDPVPAATNTGTSAVVNWTAVAGTKYKVVVTDNGSKAVLKSEIITISDTTGKYTLDKTALGTDLTPGGKYNVEVYAVGTMPGTFSTALKIAVTATKYDATTAKVDSKEITLLGAKVTATAPKTPVADAIYYMEITSVVDAKGKPDWNAGWFEKITTVGTAQAIAAQLAPSTQYFVRIVTVDKAPTAADDWSNVTKVATGKEAKFKTVAAPVATIGKSGFAMKSNDIGFKFDFKSPDLNDKKDLLKMGDPAVATTYEFDLYVASDTAKADKITGKLDGAVKVGATLTLADFTAIKDKNGNITGYKLNDAVTLNAISTALGGLEGMKSIQFQLNVTYTNTKTPDSAKNDFAEIFTKASKLTMPKWYV